MIQVFVDRFMDNKHILKEKLKCVPYYEGLVKSVIEIVTDPDDYGNLNPDPNRITVIDHGDYQGTMLFIIAEKGYQPSEYYSVSMGYGSCSYCDTMQAIHDLSDPDNDGATEKQIKQLMDVALHIVQRLRRV